MGHVKKLIALLLFASVASAQTYYEKSTFPPGTAKALYASSFHLVCDGVTDNTTAFSAMNTALAALGSAGGSLYFGPQTGVCITGQALNPRSNTIIYAEPGTVILKPGTTHSTVLLMSISSISNVVVYGLTFDGGGADYSATSPNANVTQVFASSNILFDHVTWQHTRGIALVPSTTNVNVGVINSTFTDIGNHWKTSLVASDRKQAISFCCGTTSANVGNFVRNSYFSDIGLDAISAGSQTDFSATGNVCQLEDNQRALVSSAAYGACVYFSGNVGGVIANNVSTGAQGNAIDTSGSTNLSITGNYVKNSGGAGIGIFGNDAYVTVTGNTALDNGLWLASTWRGGITTGDTTTNVTVSGNTSCDDQTPQIQPYGFQFAIHTAVNPSANGIVFGPNNFNCNLTSAFGGTNVGTPADSGLYRSNTSSQSVAELSGDVTTSGSNAVTVTKINGTAFSGLATGILKNTTTTGVPSIAVAGDFPTLNQNTSGTAANVSGTPALPSGTTATTQSASDNSTKLATTAYADRVGTSTPIINSVYSQYTLAQWGLPVILPGGGTFTTTPSAAGGLTLTTALPNTAACTATIGCYMYFPLGAICTTCNAGGNSAADSYFTQCASTTSCSVFNNRISGVPTTVGSPTSFGTITTSGAYAQTVGSFVTLATISIPGNTMGANGNFGFEQMAARPSNAGAIAQQVKYAGNIVGLNGTATVQEIALHRIVQNVGYTGKQIAFVGTTPLELSQINTAVQFTTVDTTSAQNLVFQGELITSSTDWLVTLGGTIWVNYAP